MKVIDATDHVLGRLSSRVAKMLLEGEEIVIINAEKSVVTGNKEFIYRDYLQKWQRGSVRKGPHYPRMPDRILRRTVRGMLPFKTSHGREAYRRLKVFIGVPENIDIKNAEKIEDAIYKKIRNKVTLADISRYLGAKF
ncbi:MAG: 50S ribosomal protein L13 [Thermoplasmata archaeon]|jgi:large subunit ribosomal protein L13|nr:50S ribosomal protein L13 [Euryarchaeota archaeon]MVT35928.1 50S ribosomal protein L13 [Euryarchaeota archaeon]